MSLKSDLGKRVRAIRKGRGLTQAQLAELCEVAIEHISGIERGDRAPSLEVLDRLSLSLRVPIADLFAFQKSKTPTASEEAIQAFTKHARRLSPAKVRLLAKVAKVLHRN